MSVPSSPMLHSPADIFLEYLLCLGLTTRTKGADWQGFVEELPDNVGEPTRQLVCSTTTPTNQGTFQLNGKVVQRFGVQVRINALESTDYSKIATIQNTVADARNSPKAVTLDGTTYTIHRAALDSGPLRLGRDKEGRYGFSLNYLIAITVPN